ncbi:MAG: hypothetical protein ACN4GW_10875 [Desulforhopalus sp.]
MGFLKLNGLIQGELAGGKSREDIFQELSGKSPTDVAKFAYCIASIPRKSLRAKYLKVNGVLFLLLLILAALSLLSELPIDMQQSTLFIAISIVVPLVFSYFIYQFYGAVYRLLGIWCLIDLVESLLLLQFTTAIDLVKLFVLVAVTILSFLIAVKVFPNMKLLGPKLGPDGNYLL